MKVIFGLATLTFSTLVSAQAIMTGGLHTEKVYIGPILSGFSTAQIDAVPNNSLTVSGIIDAGDMLRMQSDTEVLFRGTKLKELGDGEVSATSKEGVNGSQLFGVNQAVINTSTVANGNSQSIQNNSQALNVHRQSIQAHNQALNVNRQSIQDNNQSIYFNRQLIQDNTQALSNRINQVSEESRAGIAAGAALAGIATPLSPGEGWIGAGIGVHQDESAVAIGITGTSSNGKWIVRGGVSFDSQKQLTGHAAVNYKLW